MHVIVDFSIIPLGVGVSLSEYIAVCERILVEAGLDPQLHANGTNIEGEWEVVLGAIQRCHTALHEMGVPRIATNLRLGTRTDREQNMASKIASVRARL